MTAPTEAQIVMREDIITIAIMNGTRNIANGPIEVIIFNIIASDASKALVIVVAPQSVFTIYDWMMVGNKIQRILPITDWIKSRNPRDRKINEMGPISSFVVTDINKLTVSTPVSVC
jgi:hypothetical protein